jgi:glycosyltransferase involved in cell wall biosynthesis
MARVHFGALISRLNPISHANLEYAKSVTASLIGQSSVSAAGPKHKLQSPYELDSQGSPLHFSRMLARLQQSRVFFDGVFKGDYSLAIVNRYLARGLIREGVNLSLHSSEEGWETDPMLIEMPDVFGRFVHSYPEIGTFDIHLRNTWPPKADDMIGRRLNAFACFAWEELVFPSDLVDHFNAHLGLVMATANFVRESLRRSGLRIPIAVVGDGTDHVNEFQRTSLPASLQRSDRARVIHVSSCFPRKGSDLLVKAFADTFTNSEPVELVIKTFDNPHNSIEQFVAEIRQERPDSAPIRVLKQSMPYPQLVELIRTSDVLVAPSRGEGFGLPLAEALLLGVPVVTTAYSGQTDFCTEATAWLVDYKMTQSEAHVSAGSGMWADPDLPSLRRQLRHALTNSNASREKVASAQVLLKGHFKWADVVRRTVQAIDATMAANTISVEGAPLLIDLVSTWSQVCGIATYSEHLFGTPSLAPTLSRILAREVRGDRIEVKQDGVLVESPLVSRPWGYDRAGIGRLAAELALGQGDVLWIQHHPGFFSDQDMSQIAEALGRSLYRVKAVTLHNVHDTLKDCVASWLSEFDVVFVHSQSDVDLLRQRQVTSFVVIPHGMLARSVGSPCDTPEFTIGTFGFLYPHKNVPLLIEGFSLARRIEPRLRLRLLTCTKRDQASWRERARVEAIIEHLSLGDVVETDFRFLRDEEVIDRLSQCNLLCFPYGQSNESASGAVRLALAADRPIVCSRSAVLKDAHPYSLVLTSLDAARLGETFLALSAFPEIAMIRDAERRQFVDRHSYSIAAEHHLTVLKNLLKEKANA